MKVSGVCLASVFAMFIGVNPAPAAVSLVSRGETWQYRKGTNGPQSEWKLASAALDATWLTGPGGFGFGQTSQETNNCRTLLPDMVGSAATNYSTLYYRKTFTVTNAIAPGTRLYLRMDFDDGYIAWLDGAHLTNRFTTNAPAEPLFSDVATASHECSTGNNSPQPAETNNLGEASAWLAPGNHVLAIIGLNNAKTSGDFVQVADLYLDTPPPVPVVTNAVGGTIAVDTTWYATNRFYTITSSVTVLSNVTLTIEPGVTVWARQGCRIAVYGRLLADGTGAEPITFTRFPADTTWERILLIKAADSRFRNCVFEYANCVGDHQSYYPTNCTLPFKVAPRTYFEAVVGLACHLDFEDCLFRNLPSPNGAGDAVAIISDDLANPGPASANIRGCQFLSIGQGINTRYAHVLVENCYFVGKSGDNDDVEMYGEPAYFNLPPPIVRNNLFDMPAYEDRIHPTRCSAIIYNNLIRGSGDHGIVLRDKCAPVVFNNVIYKCPSGGITVQNQADALLMNNTIVNCGPGLKLFDHTDRWGLPYCLNPGSGRAIAINCVVWNNTAGWSLAESPYTNDLGSHLELLYCNIQSNGTVSANSTLGWGPGNTSANPLFVNQAGFDLHLTPTSPGIDAGTNSGVFVTTNLFGPTTNDIAAFLTQDASRLPRPLDSDGNGSARVDMGAYELLRPEADSNNDGVPDGWTWRYGLDPTVPGVGTGNPDLDAFSTAEEYVADTDPTNALSGFQIETITAPTPTRVMFLSSSNRLYTLFTSSNLAAPSWSTVSGQVDIPGNGSSQTLTGTNATSPAFFRVGVRVP